MQRRVEFTPRAMRDLNAMPPKDAVGIARALVVFAETGKGDVRKLRGQKGRWALRWGNWRAIYSETGQILSVLRVKDRKDVYR